MVEEKELGAITSIAQEDGRNKRIKDTEMKQEQGRGIT